MACGKISRMVLCRVGQVFGRLTILSFTRIGQNIRANCICECGQSTSPQWNNVRKLHTTSCGCYALVATAAANTTHGKTVGGKNSPEYSSWSAAKNRCLNSQSKYFKDYGARGINMFPAWADSFPEFLSFVGPRPSGTSLDRIDNNFGYEPGNVRWATQSMQCRNKRNNRMLILHGVTKCLKDWTEDYQKDYSLVFARLKYGWSLEKALTTPPRIIQRKGERENIQN